MGIMGYFSTPNSTFVKFPTQDNSNFISRTQNKHLFIEHKHNNLQNKKYFSQNREQGNFYCQNTGQSPPPILWVRFSGAKNKTWSCNLRSRTNFLVMHSVKRYQSCFLGHLTSHNFGNK